MKRVIFILVGILSFVSCTKQSKFTINGVVSDATDKILYFEASNLQGIIVLDSIKLDKKGSYSFSQEAPQAPEFYRLRLDNRVINLSIDSTETVVVNSNYEDFDKNYKVSGSENNEKIHEIVLLQSELQNKVRQLLDKAYNGKINNKVLQTEILALYQDYKDKIRREYILSAPNTTAAYYALFPKVNGYMLFDPLNNKADLRCYGAVATSFNEKYPHSDRAKNLYNIVIKGMRNTRQPKQNGIEISQDKIKSAGLIDIELRNISGKILKLSDLKGKVVLLDFNVFQNPVSAAHIFNLRDLYDKYASKGFEIYQVSLDADEHFWKQAVDALPWVCVRDEMGIYSTYTSTYNITKVPTFFLINRDNVLVERGDDIVDIDKAIKQLL